MTRSRRTSEFNPALVIHAGAGKEPASRAEAARVHEALKKIADTAYKRLLRYGAQEAVAWAVAKLEDVPQFNSGTGGKLQSDGVARLTAAWMDSESGRFSGVINIEQTKNPVLVARRLQREKDRVLAAEGAGIYARKARFSIYNPVTEEAWSEWKRKSRKALSQVRGLYGTVGAVAVDSEHHLVAATSTGGKGMEIVGRVSDSATVAGNYVSRHAAVSATGVGEEITDAALAARIVTRVDDGRTLERAFSRTFREFKAAGGRAGAIGVDVRGHVAVKTTTPCIFHAIRTAQVESGYP